jgi:hypothetical protein
MGADYLHAGARLRASLEQLEHGSSSDAARGSAASRLESVCAALLRAVLSSGSLAARVC